MRRLADRARVIATDWPGFGDLPRPPVAWTPEALSSFLEHFVRQELPPLHGTIAVGHAATYALYLAALSPGLLGRLVLIAPTWRGPLPTMANGDRPVFGTIRRAIGLPVIGPLLYRLNVNPFMVRMMVAEHVYSDAKALPSRYMDGKRGVMAGSGARFGSAAFVTGGLDRVSSREAFLDLARQAEAPVKVIYGAETPRKSRAEMAALAQLPMMEPSEMPRGKLSLHEEFPDAISKEIEDFLFRNSLDRNEPGAGA